jgi:hypothetical protein
MATKKDNTGSPDGVKGPREPDDHQVPPAPPKADGMTLALKINEKLEQGKHLKTRGGLEVGVLVLDDPEGFNGDIDKVSDKNPLKGTSLTALCKDGTCYFSN